VINAIISQNYFGKIIWPFVYRVLYDEYFTFGLERRILDKIIKKYSFERDPIQNLNRLSTIRNYFAHCGKKIFLVEEEKGIVLDPRNEEKEIDFHALYQEFKKLGPSTANYLVDIYKKIGGEII
jgi:hypothetical protein